MSNPVIVEVWYSTEEGSAEQPWFIRTLGGNGEVVYPSEGHVNMTDAEDIAKRYAPPGAMIRVTDEEGKVVRNYPALGSPPPQISLTLRIERDFTLHPPKTPEVGVLMDLIRGEFKTMAQYVAANTPSGREQSLAITELEQACFWAIGAIARAQDDG